MKSIITYKKWDIVLLPFPFTDLTAAKKRPGLIVSPDEYNDKSDVIIAFITSKLDLEQRFGDYRITQWKQAGLPKPSLIRMKFATIAKGIIIKKLGRLTSKDTASFRNLLVDFFTK